MFKDQLAEKLSASQKILVTSHIKPDADAVSSCLVLHSYLKLVVPDKDIQVQLNGDYSHIWEGLPFAENIKWGQDVGNNFQEFDSIVFLDGARLDRFTSQPEKIDLSKIISICIDHHKDPLANYSLSHQVPEYSTTMILYHELWKEKAEFSSDLAKLILLGLVTDTGVFSFVKPENANVFEDVKDLIKVANVSIEYFDQYLSVMEPEIPEILGLFMSNSKNVDLQRIPKFTYTYLDSSDLERFSIEDIKAAADKYKFTVLRQVRGHRWGFVIRPYAKNEYEISFRSRPGAPNVRLIAQEFEGGGHDLAAGGKYVLQPGEQLSGRQVAELVVDKLKSMTLELTPLS